MDSVMRAAFIDELSKIAQTPQVNATHALGKALWANKGTLGLLGVGGFTGYKAKGIKDDLTLAKRLRSGQ